MRKHNRLTGAIAAMAALAVLLGGCSSDSDKPDADASASTDVPSGDPTVETSDGGETVTSGELNEEFPSKLVPLIEGSVLASLSSPDGGFSVTVLVGGEPKTVSKKAVAKLKATGFKVKSKQKDGGGFVTVLRSPKYKVEIAATPTGEAQTSVNYVVKPR